MGIKQSIMARIKLAFLGVALFALFILFRIFNVQVLQGDHWMTVARENGLKYREVRAARGNVLSDNGAFLATSIPFYQVAIDATIASDSLFAPNIDTLSVLFAQYFQEKDTATYKAELHQARLDKNKYYVVSKKVFVSYQDRKILEQWPLIREGRYKGGVIFEKVDRRFRPYGDLARRTIGFLINSDSTDELKGRGLEFSFNEELAGKDGEALYQRIAGGNWKPIEDESMVRTINGNDIQTTLSVDIQERANQILQAALERNNANYGTLVLMEVETGEVKAMVNLGKDEDGNYTEKYNYALQGVVEPGSTMKAASMMALFESNQDIQLTDTINTENGSYKFHDDCEMTDAVEEGYGRISVQTIFEKSSNIGVSKLIFRHFQNRPELYCQYLDRFGLTTKLGLQMEGEGEPIVYRPDNEMWDGCSLPWMSVGYSMQISPLQLLTFYNAIANNGRMVEPLMVKRVLRGGHIPTKEFQARVIIPQICSPRTLSMVQTMLQGVVETGTAKNIRTDLYKIAGKTGTAHKLKKGKYINEYYTSFVGYFPADKPKYSCIVAIDDPKGGGHFGADVSAPVFKQLSDWLFVRGIDKKLEDEPWAAPSAPSLQAGHYKQVARICDDLGLKWVMANTVPWVRTDAETDTVYMRDIWYSEETVPDVKGMTLKDAMYLLENGGLKVRTNGTGRVMRQSLPPGRRIRRKGETIVLQLG